MKSWNIFILLSTIVMATAVAFGVENNDPEDLNARVLQDNKAGKSVYPRDMKRGGGPKVHDTDRPFEIYSIDPKRDRSRRKLSWVSRLFSFVGLCIPGPAGDQCRSNSNASEDHGGSSNGESNGENSGENGGNAGSNDSYSWQKKVSDDTGGGEGKEGGEDVGAFGLWMIALLASVAIGAMYMGAAEGDENEGTHPLHGVLSKRKRMFNYLAEKSSISRQEEKAVKEVDVSNADYRLA